MANIRAGIALNPTGSTWIGSDPKNNPPLDHPQVQSRHAEIFLSGGRATLRDMGAGTVINGRRIVGQIVPLEPHARVEIGPFAFLFTGQHLRAESSLNHIELIARGLNCVVGQGARERALLQNISMVIPAGKFVCLLGPSGCGKSTLMRLLSGRTAPQRNQGQVWLNRRDLHANFDTFKRYMALVPQKPLLHSDLTVDEALRYTARLRLPASCPSGPRIESLVAKFGLQTFRATPIKQISGGQEKRTCLANELISDPGLVFLDEVTSGLDEATDRDMMELFRELSRNGKTVVCVTHCLVNVVDTADLVIFLTPGGRLAYIGTPQDALSYFKVERLGEVYGLLTVQSPDHWARRFAESEEYAGFNPELLPDANKLPPPSAPNPASVSKLAETLTIGYQTVQLISRQLLLLSRDGMALLTLLGQVLLVAVFLWFAFGRIEPYPEDSKDDKEIADIKQRARIPNAPARDAVANDCIERAEQRKFVSPTVIKRANWVRRVLNLTFLLAVTSFWFGCNNSAREIVRERGITTSERLFNLRAVAYYLSKLLLLVSIGWLQVSLLLAIVWPLCAPPGRALDHLPVLLALALVGTILGLLISSIASSEQVAVTLIPVAVIPQIILSGAIVSLQGIAAVLGMVFITTYWGKQAMDGLLDPASLPGQFARQTADPSLIPPEVVGSVVPLLAILLHAFVLLVVTVQVSRWSRPVAS